MDVLKGYLPNTFASLLHSNTHVMDSDWSTNYGVHITVMVFIVLVIMVLAIFFDQLLAISYYKI
jgi:hypothetical protein